jgi:hypothetical protein
MTDDIYVKQRCGQKICYADDGRLSTACYLAR